ncbi:AMP-binding protein [Vagococcus fessus]|uniref:Acetate--CoA ligase n=1 Tax=Vagococcus fessus TaxID=120370 RepID=A0A430A7F5_9ENTE|nr:acyl-CoA synthetase [Vagococcus fessus]RSU03046.1 acetate--CoA ligase [Vagococcus fessus]
MKFPENTYEPLNLFSNFKEASVKFPEVTIQSDSDLPAFPEFGREVTYEKATEAIVKRANQLIKLGVKKEDKVIIFKSSRFDTYLLAVAVSYIGAVPAMISHHLPTEIMSVLSDRLEKPWLIFDEATEPVATELKASDHIHAIKLADLVVTPIEESDYVEQAFLDRDQISYITHTSGTTGIPKLIAHSANSMGWRTTWQRNVFDLIPEKKLMAFHISPVHSRFNIGISSAMSKGFPLLNISNLAEEQVKATLIQYQPYTLETHPNNFVRWSRLAKKAPEAFNSVSYFHSTFDAINKGTMADFLNASADANACFMQVYGQSECGPMIFKFHKKETVMSVDSRDMGIGMPGLTEVKIVDAEGNEQPANTPGNILMLSKGRALTYYKEDQRFADNVYDAWWDSGDYGIKNEAGELFLYDRQVDLIETVDSNLALEDVLLDQLEFLDEVVIVRGIDDKPQPIISVAEGCDMDWSRWWNLVAEMPTLNEPIIMTFDAIPRTATMKVQRLVLEKEIKEGRLA